MCKVLSEGGPCYSHLSQKIDSLQREMNFDAREKGKALGISADPAAAQKECESLKLASDMVIHKHQSNIQTLKQEAGLIAARGKSLKDSYSPEDVNAALEIYRSENADGYAVELENGFKKVAMAEAIRARVNVIDETLAKQKSIYDAKAKSGELSYNYNEMYAKKVEETQQMREVLLDRQNSLEQEAANDFNGNYSAQAMAKELSQQIIPSSEYLNAQEQFTAQKALIEKEQKIVASEKRSLAKELKRVNDNPPLQKAEFDAFVSHEYSKTDSGKRKTAQIEKLRDELSQTPTAINELREQGKKLGGFNNPAGRELIRQANQNFVKKSIRVGEAQGKSRSEIHISYANDPNLVQEREHNHRVREADMKIAAREQQILVGKKRTAKALQEAALVKKQMDAEKALLKKNKPVVKSGNVLRRFVPPAPAMTPKEYGELAAKRFREDPEVQKRFDDALERVIRNQSVSSSRRALSLQTSILAPPKMNESFKNTPSTKVVASSIALARLNEARRVSAPTKKQSLPIPPARVKPEPPRLPNSNAVRNMAPSTVTKKPVSLAPAPRPLKPASVPLRPQRPVPVATPVRPAPKHQPVRGVVLPKTSATRSIRISGAGTFDQLIRERYNSMHSRPASTRPSSKRSRRRDKANRRLWRLLKRITKS